MLKRRHETPDHVLTSLAHQLLANRGLRPPCNIAVSTSGGVITLTGQVEHAHQQQTALAAIRGVSGARGFSSQLKLAPIERDWDKPTDTKSPEPIAREKREIVPEPDYSIPQGGDGEVS